MTHEENPFAPPKFVAVSPERHVDQPDVAWRDKNLLVVRKGAELPDRCLKCNAPAEGYRFEQIWLAKVSPQYAAAFRDW